MKNLKDQRKKKGLSQMELSKLAGMGRYNIGLAENGQRELSKEETKKIKLALKGVSVDKAKNEKK